MIKVKINKPKFIKATIKKTDDVFTNYADASYFLSNDYIGNIIKSISTIIKVKNINKRKKIYATLTI